LALRELPTEVHADEFLFPTETTGTTRVEEPELVVGVVIVVTIVVSGL
jgi:hypothetical protein